jgi:hypothetical protein
MTDQHSKPPTDGDDNAPHIHLPSRRRTSPWRLALVVGAVVLVVVLAPLWIDPLTVREILGVQPSLTAQPTAADVIRPQTNPPILHGSPAADDSFGREIASGFGSTKVGGMYSQTGTGTIFVTGGAATVSLADGAQGAAILDGASLTTADEQVTVSLASGAPSAQAGLAMRANDDSFYAALVRYFGGVASVSVESVVDGKWVTIAGPINLPEIDLAQPIRIRADSTGFDPTTIRVRAWNAGQPEPGQWAINIVDWTGHMQQPGSIGLAWQISDERRAVITLDDYTAQGSN